MHNEKQKASQITQNVISASEKSANTLQNDYILVSLPTPQMQTKEFAELTTAFKKAQKVYNQCFRYFGILSEVAVSINEKHLKKQRLFNNYVYQIQSFFEFLKNPKEYRYQGTKLPFIENNADKMNYFLKNLCETFENKEPFKIIKLFLDCKALTNYDLSKGYDTDKGMNFIIETKNLLGFFEKVSMDKYKKAFNDLMVCTFYKDVAFLYTDEMPF